QVVRAVLRRGGSCGSPADVVRSRCTSGGERQFGKQIAVGRLKGDRASTSELVDGCPCAVRVLTSRQFRNDCASDEIAIAFSQFGLPEVVLGGAAAAAEDNLVEVEARVGAFAYRADGFVEAFDAVHTVDRRLGDRYYSVASDEDGEQDLSQAWWTVEQHDVVGAQVQTFEGDIETEDQVV